MSKRDAWSREPGTHEIEAKGKKYRNLVKFTRLCATCAQPFSMYVSQSVAEGKKSNNNFGLKNCELHRNRSTDSGETERLRTMVSTLQAEVDPVYARNKELVAELQVAKAENASLRARLGLYELSERFQALGGKPNEDTKSSEFPWCS